jgi:hypothetical protein
MSESSTGKAGQELVRAERGRFAAGAPSANPAGRPKRGQTLAEQWRRETDWPKLRARLEGIVHDAKAKHADVIGAARELLDRSWGKPLTSHELHVSTGEPERQYNLDALSTDEIRLLLERIDAAELPVGSGTEP